MNLSKKLDLWEQANLINSRQKTAISDFENKAKQPTLLYGLLFLSAFCIGLGIIALIASNWSEIPDFAKIATDFAIMGAIIYGIIKTKNNQKPIFSEALIVLYAILSLATIGLIAQIYHIPSRGLNGLLFWSVITLPLVLVTKKSILPLFLFPALLISSINILNRFGIFHNFFMFLENYASLTTILVIFLLMVVSYYLSAPLKDKAPHINYAIKAWMIICIIAFAFFIDVRNLDSYFYHQNLNSQTFAVWGALLAVALAFFSLNYQNLNKYLIYAFASLVFFTLMADVVSIPYGFSRILGGVSTIIMLSILAAYAYKTGRTKLFNVASSLIALRFFIAYLQVFGSLLTTGSGLIISGLIFLAIAYTWQKTRIKIATQIKGEK